MSVLDILILYFLLNISFVQHLGKVVEEWLSYIFIFIFIFLSSLMSILFKNYTHNSFWNTQIMYVEQEGLQILALNPVLS